VKRVILLADDSPTIQRFVTQIFQDGDYEIVCVSNGDAAIRKFEEIRPALVLADIYMPGRNGYEVCAYVKKHAQLSHTPVVLLAGAFDAFDEETAYEAGASTHVTKPFEPHALVALVESLLSAEKGKSEPEPPEDTRPADLTTAQVAAPEPPEVPEPSPEPSVPPAPPEQVMPPPAPEAPVASVLPPPSPAPADASGDLLGLEELFKPGAAEASNGLKVTDEEIERIAERVLQRISTQVIESVAWDVVPDIATKVLREELKRQS
jgi:CheY-like chemotaxis protein